MRSLIKRNACGELSDHAKAEAADAAHAASELRFSVGGH